MDKSFFGTTQMRILVALSLLMAIIALASYASLNFEKIQYSNPTPATISVIGEGEVLAVPDIGRFSFSVMAENAEASVAQELSGTKINEILAYLREQGIEDKDIKVEQYNLYPRWRYEERVCPIGSYCPGGERVQDGFEVTQSIAVKVRETKDAPKVIAGVGERGATDISNLNFSVDDTEALRDEARAKAIENAQAKAVVLAKQLGVRIVHLTAYSETGAAYQPYYKEMSMALDAPDGGFGGAELPMGEESTLVRVNITYEIK
ncbi:SIMPL domain-containing protein [Candidatus Parcubacteria bacterium]|nr:SIMPL domain-containing protein [Candidatus Parcubacteria bacterium]